MDFPKVTVVIPIYNVEKYLNRCINSIVNQTYRCIEILLIDDGSPDKCPEICDEWAKKDARIRVIHKANDGLGMARNTGIENATGEYICFFDSDDYVDHTIIQKCIINSLEHNSDVVIFGYANVFEDGKIENAEIKTSRITFSGEDICKTLLSGMYTYDMGFGISAWGKFFRLSSIVDNNIRFKSERNIISEDAFFALEYYPKIKKVSILHESLYFYCKRSDSLSRAYKKERQAKNDDFIQQSIQYIEKENLPNSVKRHILARYHMYTIAAIKQLMAADISSEDKKIELNWILKSKILHKTLGLDVIRLHKLSVALFLLCVKYKLYPICRLLIALRR